MQMVNAEYQVGDFYHLRVMWCESKMHIKASDQIPTDWFSGQS